jgi:hypothetical protein
MRFKHTQKSISSHGNTYASVTVAQKAQAVAQLIAAEKVMAAEEAALIQESLALNAEAKAEALMIQASLELAAEVKAAKVQDFINARTQETHAELLDIDLDISAMANNLDNLLHPKQSMASNVMAKIGNAISYLNPMLYFGGAKVDATNAPLPAPLSPEFVEQFEANLTPAAAAPATFEVVEGHLYPQLVNASGQIIAATPSAPAMDNQDLDNSLVTYPNLND